MLYRGHDAFLFTSRYEAWGMPVLEAMACGLPVVTTDCLGVRAFAVHGDNALMAPPGDLQQLSHLLVAVLRSPLLRQRCAACSACITHTLCLQMSRWQGTLALERTFGGYPG